ncbi:hypothetical protein L0Y34_01670 [Candidatus Parcubacteria bacterium]|nr:hypothetical protein [Candidatus Parcubacteria bacterium]
MEPKPNIVQDVFHSYLAMIENSVGTNAYRNGYFQVNGELTDILRDGELSCAYFVSTVLHAFYLIKERHTMTVGTLRDMHASGWYEISEPKRGAVVHWGPKKDDLEKHPHIGFCLDPDTAVSTNSGTRMVATHLLQFGERDILAYFWHEKLGT